MPQKPKTFLFAFMGATALLVGACGGGTSSTDGSLSAAASSEPATSTSAASSGGSESPLGDLIGIPFNDDDAAEQYFSDL